ncbi:recombinase family protein [Aeribacillus composti]|uniref:Site-specific recombinase for integration and excision n=1 Tax=Anoxybacillus phage A403 TaxID=2099336 RepID=A0A2P1JU08_9CAUD|nr:integrase [Anoxybacillus phage A403]AVO22625.1 site-specific recombinase for integration and excision [Anoxybacillus phage A403]
MKAALYIRVSTQEQAIEGYSISSQRQKLTAYSYSQGWEIVDYYVDEGKSAKDLDRPELKRMLDDIKQHKIDVVLVYRLDRITRSVMDLYELLGIFDKYHCKFKSATEVYDTTSATGRLFITLVASMAQWERETIAERVSMGMAEKVRQGEWHGSEAPYGFYYNIETKELVIDESEAHVVRDIFTKYLDGLSDRKIAIYLNEKKVPTRKGARWRENRIRYILTNPIYIGNLRWGVRVNREQAFQVENAVPAIIDKETFEKAQMIRNSRRRFHGRQATSDFIFSGVLKCARCGSPMKGHTHKCKNKRNKSYRCIKVLFNECDMPLISERIIEYQFLKAVKELIFKEIKIETKSSDQHIDKEKIIKNLQTELNKIEERRKKWQYAWVNEMIDDNQFKDRMNEELIKEQEIKRKLEDINVEIEEFEMDNELKELMSDALENWIRLDDHEKKQLIQIAINKIIVEKIPSNKVLERAKILEIEFN